MREKGCARVLGGDRTWASLFAVWLRVEGEGLKAGKAGRTRREEEKATGGGRRNPASLPEGRRHAEVRHSCVRLRAVDETRDNWSREIARGTGWCQKTITINDCNYYRLESVLREIEREEEKSGTCEMLDLLLSF